MEKNRKSNGDRRNNRDFSYKDKFESESINEGMVIGRNAVRELLKSGRDIDKIIVQKGGFLAAEEGVEVSIHFQQRLSTGFFGGEGFIMQRLSGRGTAFVEIDGDLMEYILKPGQKIVVDTGNVAGFEPSVQMDIQTVPGAKNMFFGGEGIFNTVLTGPGRVWLQTMPIDNVANAIRPYIPTKSD